MEVASAAATQLSPGQREDLDPVVAVQDLGRSRRESRAWLDGEPVLPSRSQQPEPDRLLVEVGVGDERVDVDHRQYGAEVHRRARLGELDRQDPGGCAGGEQAARQHEVINPEAPSSAPG